MAPEQIRGERADRQTDLFSLGIVVYEMLSGRYPFTEDGHLPIRSSDIGFLERLRNDQWMPPSPSRFQPLVPSAVDDIVARLLAKERAKRYRLAEEAKEALEEVMKWM